MEGGRKSEKIPNKWVSLITSALLDCHPYFVTLALKEPEVDLLVRSCVGD